MFTTRSKVTACVLISQHSLMKSRCVLACCCSGLWSSFTHMLLERMPCRSCLTHSRLGRTSASSHSYTRLLIVTDPRHRTSDTRMVSSLSRVVSAGESKIFLPRSSTSAAVGAAGAAGAAGVLT